MSQSESSAEKRLSQYRWFEILTNRPFPSSLGPLYQNEVRCSTFLVEMSFICMRMKTHFHIKGEAPNLVLVQRPGGTRKWPILRNPLKFAFLTIFGCKTPYLGSDVMVLYLQLVVRNFVF